MLEENVMFRLGTFTIYVLHSFLFYIFHSNAIRIIQREIYICDWMSVVWSGHSPYDIAIPYPTL